MPSEWAGSVTQGPCSVMGVLQVWKDGGRD